MSRTAVLRGSMHPYHVFQRMLLTVIIANETFCQSTPPPLRAAANQIMTTAPPLRRLDTSLLWFVDSAGYGCARAKPTTISYLSWTVY